MKILYLSSPAPRPDYQCDMLFHGLRSQPGHTVTDYPRLDHLYTDYGETAALYGRGFTMTRLLPEVPLDRSNIAERISAREFDLIIYGSVCRGIQFLQRVSSVYPREKILFIDGEDQPDLIPELPAHGIYFKRELTLSVPGVYPIFFAIPVTKIGTIKPTLKDKVRAYIDPRDKSTYIYTDERSYYQDYSRSLFAFTMKKAGWDSLRTLEIMANGCLPIFLDLAECPPLTCIQLPKSELLEVLPYADRDGTFWDTESGKAIWKSLWRRVHLKFATHCTTNWLATYVLETQQREAQVAA
jgi:hypothetical protein